MPRERRQRTELALELARARAARARPAAASSCAPLALMTAREEAALAADRFAVEQPLRGAFEAEHRRGQAHGLRELEIHRVDRLVAKALERGDRLRASRAGPRAAPPRDAAKRRRSRDRRPPRRRACARVTPCRRCSQRVRPCGRYALRRRARARKRRRAPEKAPSDRRARAGCRRAARSASSPSRSTFRKTCADAIARRRVERGDAQRLPQVARECRPLAVRGEQLAHRHVARAGVNLRARIARMKRAAARRSRHGAPRAVEQARGEVERGGQRRRFQTKAAMDVPVERQSRRAPARARRAPSRRARAFRGTRR